MRGIFKYNLIILGVLVFSALSFSSVQAGMLTLCEAGQQNCSESGFSSYLSLFGTSAGYTPYLESDYRSNAASLIRIALSFIGSLFAMLTVYSGYLWLTAGGNTEQVQKSRSILRHAIVGMIIVLVSYSFSYYLMALITTMESKPEDDWEMNEYIMETFGGQTSGSQKTTSIVCVPFYYNCSSFSFQNEAQRVFDYCNKEDDEAYDIHGLDKDGDGKACEDHEY